jgi:hypothetical protein
MRALGSSLPLARGDKRTNEMNLIQTLEAEQIAKLAAKRPKIPEFRPGDTLRRREGRRRRAHPRSEL